MNDGAGGAKRTRGATRTRAGARLLLHMADYIQRMVEGLARALARIAAGRKAGRLSEAPAELAELAVQVAGIDLKLVDVVGAHAVAAQLTDRRQLEALAAICEERAEVDAAGGDAAGAARWRGHAATFRGRAETGRAG